MKNKLYVLTLAMCLCSSFLFAQSEGEPLPPGQSMWQTFSLIAIAVLSFYLILWRPEQKRRKMLEEQRSSLKVGDRVYAMGIIGTVSKISENTVILRMVDGSKIEFLKAAITDIMPENEAEPKKEKEKE